MLTGDGVVSRTWEGEETLDVGQALGAAWALGSVGRPVESSLIVALLGDPDSDAREAAIRLVSGVRSSRVATIAANATAYARNLLQRPAPGTG